MISRFLSSMFAFIYSLGKQEEDEVVNLIEFLANWWLAVFVVFLIVAMAVVTSVIEGFRGRAR
jgi:hypothetical protein